MIKDEHGDNEQILKLEALCSTLVTLFYIIETILQSIGIVGEDARLPCVIKQFHSDVDRPKVVMWFRNGTETPFYT